MKAVIIEDEIVAAQALQTLIKEVNPDIQIIAVLQSIDESVEWFQIRPDFYLPVCFIKNLMLTL